MTIFSFWQVVWEDVDLTVEKSYSTGTLSSTRSTEHPISMTSSPGGSENGLAGLSLAPNVFPCKYWRTYTFALSCFTSPHLTFSPFWCILYSIVFSIFPYSSLLLSCLLTHFTLYNSLLFLPHPFLPSLPSFSIPILILICIKTLILMLTSSSKLPFLSLLLI